MNELCSRKTERWTFHSLPPFQGVYWARFRWYELNQFEVWWMCVIFICWLLRSFIWVDFAKTMRKQLLFPLLFRSKWNSKHWIWSYLKHADKIVSLLLLHRIIGSVIRIIEITPTGQMNRRHIIWSYMHVWLVIMCQLSVNEVRESIKWTVSLFRDLIYICIRIPNGSRCLFIYLCNPIAHVYGVRYAHTNT